MTARLLALVLVAACDVTTDMADDPTTSAATGAAGAETTGRAASDTAREPATTTTTTDASSDADATGANASPEPDRPFDYVRARPYPRLVIEIDAVPGYDPYPSTVAQIGEVVGALVDKPGGIEVVPDGALPFVGSGYAWTQADRDTLAADTFDLPLADDAIAIHVMFVDGHASEDAGDDVLLGQAWAHRHVIMYKQRITAGCEGRLLGALTATLCERTELLLLQHEIGHVLGLVDFGLPMQTPHDDPDHGPHDIDPACIMYWHYDGLDLVTAVVDELLSGTPPVVFGPECLADLAAAR